ncbi:MAG: hypothetical protein WC796_03440 [Candidatus Pacearchaeota archaeon]|jgi:hypothetical protein
MTEQTEQERQRFMQTLGLLDMIYEMQVTALAGMTRGSYKGMEEGVEKVKVLTELERKGILPYRESK